MKAYLASGDGDAFTLNSQDVPAPPRPLAGQVRVAIRSASLNYRDLLVSRGTFHASGGSYIPLSDGAGEVTEVGEGVWQCSPGDKVALTFNQHWIAGDWSPSPGAGGRGGGPSGLPGVLCEELVVHQDEIVVIPDYLGFDEAACLPCAAVTAWHGLCGAAPLKPGQTVLVQGTGGVSLFALQFAKLFGARVVAITSSPEKVGRLGALDADVVHQYAPGEDWSAPVLEVTQGRGVDLVVEVGGGTTIGRSIASVRQMGRISVIGLLSGLPSSVEGLFARGVSMDVVRVGTRADFEEMLRAMDFHRLQPVIDRVFAFEAADDAIARLKSGRHVGKIVITLDR